MSEQKPQKRQKKLVKALVAGLLLVAALGAGKYWLDGQPALAPQTCWFHKDAQVYVIVAGHENNKYQMYILDPRLPIPMPIEADIRKVNKDLDKLIELDCKTGEPLHEQAP